MCSHEELGYARLLLMYAFMPRMILGCVCMCSALLCIFVENASKSLFYEEMEC